MQISRSQLGWTFLGILAWGSLSPILAQNKTREIGRPHPPNAVPLRAEKVPAEEARASHPAVMRLAFSPDGRVLATASADETIGLWDIETGELLTTLSGDGAQDLRFSPDGWMLGAAGSQRSYQFWEVTSADRLVKVGIPKIADGVLKYRFSPELDRLAIGSDLGQVHLMETATGKLLHGHGKLPLIRVFEKARVGAVALSPNASLLAIGSGIAKSSNPSPNQIVLWDFAERKIARTLGSPILEDGPARADSFRRLEFSSDGSTLAAMHSRRGLFLWDTGRGFHWPTILISPDEPFSLSSDGKMMARLKKNSQSQVDLLEVPTGRAYRTINLEKPIGALAVSPDGRFLAAGAKDSHDVMIRKLKPAAMKKSPTSDNLKQAVDWLSQKLAEKGREGMAVLIAGGDSSVKMLAPHLKLEEIQTRQENEIQHLIHDLDDDNFFTRENASKELWSMGQTAVPALKAELKKDPSFEVASRIKALLKQSNNSAGTLSAEALRRIRAIQVLEKIGTARAQDLLRRLAKGPESAQEAHEAVLALKRLKRLHKMKAGR